MTRKRLRTRRKRRQDRQALRHGPEAKARHTSRAGRTGSVQAKKLKGRLREIERARNGHATPKSGAAVPEQPARPARRRRLAWEEQVRLDDAAAKIGRLAAAVYRTMKRTRAGWARMRRGRLAIIVVDDHPMASELLFDAMDRIEMSHVIVRPGAGKDE